MNATSIASGAPSWPATGCLDAVVTGCKGARVAEKGDSSTVGELFRKHGAMVFRRAYRILGRREDAEEAMHEVFIRVLRRQGQFEGRSEVTTWLYEITTNYCLNQLRDRKRRRELFEANVGEPEHPSQAEPADLILLRRLLTEADEEQAQAVVYVFLDGMSQDEAAALLGVSQRTVSNRVDRFMRWAEKRAGGIRAEDQAVAASGTIKGKQ